MLHEEHMERALRRTAKWRRFLLVKKGLACCRAPARLRRICGLHDRLVGQEDSVDMPCRRLVVSAIPGTVGNSGSLIITCYHPGQRCATPRALALALSR